MDGRKGGLRVRTNASVYFRIHKGFYVGSLLN